MTRKPGMMNVFPWLQRGGWRLEGLTIKVDTTFHTIIITT